MFGRKLDSNAQNLQEVIDELMSEMRGYDAHSPEYATMADQLVKIYGIKNQKRHDRVSKDTMATIAGNLAGIALILNFERMGVITSKAMGLVMKLR